MLMNGLTKGALMLVLGAVFTWLLVAGFEKSARSHASATVSVPAMADAPIKRAASQWQF
jgi:hypothetical protein